MGDGLLVGRPFCCSVARTLPIINGFEGKTRFCVMSSDYSWVVLLGIGELLVEHSGKPSMQLDALGAQQSTVGCILHQRVLKNITRLRG